MLRLALILFTIAQTPVFADNGSYAFIVNGRSRDGAATTVYSANAARITAERIRHPSELAQDKIDDFKFYTVFCAYGAYRFLDKSMLGSWEFADRIENLFVDWPQADPQAIEEARLAAARARMGNKIKYEPRSLPEFIPWLEALSEGEEVIVSAIDIELSGLIESLSSAGLNGVVIMREKPEKTIKLNSELSPRTLKRHLLDGLNANGYTFRNLQKAAARTKGVRRFCEAEVD